MSLVFPCSELCLACKTLAHPGVPCARNLLQQPADRQLWNLARAENWRSCPKCKYAPCAIWVPALLHALTYSPLVVASPFSAIQAHNSMNRTECGSALSAARTANIPCIHSALSGSRHLVQRVNGCDHMQCVCGQAFCYACGEIHRGHPPVCPRLLAAEQAPAAVQGAAGPLAAAPPVATGPVG